MRIAVLSLALVLALPAFAREDAPRKSEALHPAKAVQTVSDKRVDAPSASAGASSAPAAGWGPLGFRSGWVAPDWAAPPKTKVRKPRR